MPGEGGQVVSMAGQQTSLPSLRHQTTVVTSAPPTAHSHAHSSPKHVSGHVSGGRGVTRGAEQQYMIISSPNKKAKYSIAGGQHASILRNQLVTKDMVTGNNVEVKSEPLSMIGGNPGMRVTRGHRVIIPLFSGQHDEVPSSEANVSVTEFISSDLLPPLPHGE